MMGEHAMYNCENVAMKDDDHMVMLGTKQMINEYYNYWKIATVYYSQ